MTYADVSDLQEPASKGVRLGLRPDPCLLGLRPRVIVRTILSSCLNLPPYAYETIHHHLVNTRVLDFELWRVLGGRAQW
jgi:hypothetical protein